MKMIIAGSRTITSVAALNRVIDHITWINPDFFTRVEKLISGTAKGADQLGEYWALFNDVPVERIPADWDKHGAAAGPIRNKVMAEKADFAIILWDGSSHGAWNMVENMQKLKKPYFLDVVK